MKLFRRKSSVPWLELAESLNYPSVESMLGNMYFIDDQSLEQIEDKLGVSGKTIASKIRQIWGETTIRPRGGRRKVNHEQSIPL